MPRILICDDDARIRGIYRRLLTLEGYEVIQCRTADYANEALKNNEIDLMLLDIKMPEVDGSEFYETIQLFHKELKTIVTSVLPVDEQMRLIHGAFDYYDKSHGTDMLLEKVKNALED